MAVDALVGLAVVTIAVSAAVALAADVAGKVARSQDRLTAARIAETLYEDLYAGDRLGTDDSGTTEGRTWRYEITPAASVAAPSSARRATITVARRWRGDLVLEAILPPEPVRAAAPATASSSS
jgi:hypothetical protein